MEKLKERLRNKKFSNIEARNRRNLMKLTQHKTPKKKEEESTEQLNVRNVENKVGGVLNT